MLEFSPAHQAYRRVKTDMYLKMRIYIDINIRMCVCVCACLHMCINRLRMCITVCYI